VLNLKKTIRIIHRKKLLYAWNFDGTFVEHNWQAVTQAQQ
jgi:hypothetical protein